VAGVSAHAGRPLGSTDPADPQRTEYNQVINGGKDYTQTEFSNSAYASLGAGFGCQRGAAESVKPLPSPTSAASVFIDATPDQVNADGASTSLIEVAVSDQDGSPTANIFQGTSQALEPTAADTFPASVVADGRPVTFTTSYTNPAATPIIDPAVNLTLYPGTSATNLPASQVRLSYSTTGAAGPFTPIPLTGSTIGDGAITAVAPDIPIATIAAGATTTITYRLAIATGAAGGTAPRDLLRLEAFLEQLNPAAGTVTVLAETAAANVDVSDPARLPSGRGHVLGAIGTA
jgi:hypothetical protein